MADGSVTIEAGLDSSSFEKGLLSLSGLAKTGLKTTLGVITAATAGIVAFGTASVKSGAEFDSAISQLAATMGTTTDQITELRDKAKELGASTSFSATEAAEGLNILAQAGYDATAQMDMIGSVLDLAAAGATTMDSAASYLSATLKGYCVSAEETGDMTVYYSNMIAKGATMVKTSVDDLGTALSNSAATANTYGQEVETTTTALLAMADGNLVGAEAATDLKRLMISLYAPTDEAASALKELGVSCYDESGNARDLLDVIEDLQTATAGMSEEQSAAYINTILTAAGMNAYNAITTKTADEIDQMTESLVDCEDAAAAMAATQLDNLEGDITIAKSALEGLQIVINDEVSPSLRGLVQMGTEQLGILTDAIGEGGLQGGIEACGEVLANVVGYVTALAPSIIETASSLITNFCEGLKNTTLVTDAVGETITALINVLLSCTGDIWSTALVLITNLAGGLADGVPDIMGAGIGMVAQLVDAIGENGPQLAQAAVDIINSLTAYLAENFPSVVQSGLETLLSFSEGLRENVGYIVDAALELIKTLAQGIIANIPTIIETVPTIVTNIAGCINDNAPKLVTTAVTLIGQLAAGLVQAIPTLVANIPQIIQAIVAVFTAFNWINLGSSIISAMKNGVTNFAKSLPTAFSEFCQNCYAIVKNWDWLTLGKTIIQAILNGITSLASTIPEAFTSIATAVTNISWWEVGLNVINGLVNGVVDNLGSIADAAGDLASNLLSGFCSFLGINSPSKVMEEQGGYIVDGVVNGVAGLPDAMTAALNESLTSVTEWGSQLVSALGTSINAATANVGQYFSGMGTSIITALSSSLTAVTAWGSTLSGTLKSAVAGAVSGVGSAFVGMSNQVASGLSTTLSAVTSWGKTLTSTCKSAVQTAVSSVTSQISKLPSNIAKPLSSVVSSVATWSKTLSTAFNAASMTALNVTVTQISKLSPQMAQQLTDTISKVNSFASSLNTVMKSAGSAAVSAIYSGLSSLTSKVAVPLAAVTTKVSSWGSTLRSSFTSIGKNVISGIISGISSMVGSLYSSIQSALSGLVSKAKSALGIHSPSTIFRDKIGKQVVAGIAVGIEKYTSTAISSVQKLAKSLVSTAKSANKTGEYTEIGKDVVSAYSDGIDSYVDKAEESVENLINKQISTLKKKNKSLSSQISKLGSNLISAYTDALEEAAEEAKDELEDTLTDLTESVQEKYDEIVKMQESLQSKLGSYGSLYDTDDDGNISITNFDDEIKALKQYNSNIAYLKDKISDDLLNEIGEMDVDEALTYTNALMEMSDAELSAYNKQYEQKQALAAKVAKNFYADQLSELQTNYISQVEAAFEATQKKLQTAGQNAIKGFISGMEKTVSSSSKSYKKIAQSLVNALKKQLGIHSPSTVFRDEVGAYVPAGVAVGVEENASVAEDAVRDLADNMVDVAGDTKAYENAGEAAAAAIAEGVRDGAENAMVDLGTIADVSEVAEAAVTLDANTDALQEKLNNLSAEVALSLPDITPYIDLMEAAVSAKTAEIASKVDAMISNGVGIVDTQDSNRMNYEALAKAIMQAFVAAGISIKANERELGRLIATYT